MNQEIKELQKELKAIQREEDKLRNKSMDIQIKMRDIHEKELREKVAKKFHVNDYFLSNNGVTNYHCTVFDLYEVLEVKTGRWPQIKVRHYKLGFADGDYYSHIEKENLQNFSQVGKKISKKQSEELKDIIYNPELYENSKWNITED